MLAWKWHYFVSFYRTSVCESGLGRRNSVCPSVHPSHAWIVTKLNDALQIFWYHTNAATLTPTGVGRQCPLSSQICAQSDPPPFEKCWLRPIYAYNVSTERDSGKKVNYDEYKSTTGFPTSYRWSAYITPKSKKGGSKSNFCFFRIKVNFSQIKSAIKFLCVKTSSGKVVAQPFLYLMVHRY